MEDSDPPVSRPHDLSGTTLGMTYGWKYRHFAGPGSRAMSPDHTSLGARATTSGFGWLGWLRCARRSRTAFFPAGIRYIVRSEQRQVPSSHSVACTSTSAGARAANCGEHSTEKTFARSGASRARAGVGRRRPVFGLRRRYSVARATPSTPHTATTPTCPAEPSAALKSVSRPRGSRPAAPQPSLDIDDDARLAEFLAQPRDLPLQLPHLPRLALPARGFGPRLLASPRSDPPEPPSATPTGANGTGPRAQATLRPPRRLAGVRPFNDRQLVRRREAPPRRPCRNLRIRGRRGRGHPPTLDEPIPFLSASIVSPPSPSLSNPKGSRCITDVGRAGQG